MNNNSILDRWFDGLGFVEMTWITGVKFDDKGNFEQSVHQAHIIWDKIPRKRKLEHYDEIGFKHHAFKNEGELFKSITTENNQS